MINKSKAAFVLIAGIIPLFAFQAPRPRVSGPAVELSPSPLNFGYVRRDSSRCPASAGNGESVRPLR
jgi:hypothetical protein